ncbi:hypothetical protein CPB84DRAFT_1678829, partial [Gymnopilus junonius]
MYLLGNPDHYTSHSFVPFYWLNYVSYVRQNTGDVVEDRAKNKVCIVKKCNGFVGISAVYNYVYRSEELENLTLYEWMRCYVREAIPKPKKHKGRKSETEEDVVDVSFQSLQSVLTDLDVDNSDTSVLIDNISPDGENSSLPDGRFQFLEEHPLRASHCARYIKKNKLRIPNFAGANLPRRDGGDRELYCCTMLTLFKPWRTGPDLKACKSWDETFAACEFSKEQLKLMDNCNIRYECLDARDDYRQQMKKG